LVSEVLSERKGIHWQEHIPPTCLRKILDFDLGGCYPSGVNINVVVIRTARDRRLTLSKYNDFEKWLGKTVIDCSLDLTKDSIRW